MQDIIALQREAYEKSGAKETLARIKQEQLDTLSKQKEEKAKASTKAYAALIQAGIDPETAKFLTER